MSLENCVSTEDADAVEKSDVITDKKLSPSEEVVTSLVNQMVSDSVKQDKDSGEPSAEAEAVTRNNKQGSVKQKGKRQSSKGSPKKGGKK